MTSFFFLQAEKNSKNHDLVDRLSEACENTKQQGYLINKPLGDTKYSYGYDGAIVLLMPKHQIVFIDVDGHAGQFDEFVDEFLEDLGSISDKYRYKDFIGRPRTWKDLWRVVTATQDIDVDALLEDTKIHDLERQRVCELLISLLTGSINDIEKVQGAIPDNILDKVKKKILLFDGDQTRFIYESLDKTPIRIQGLSGTGKTELLLHKLKELYVDQSDKKIIFTCHNKILADNLRKRIPDFFNFMKVEQQIAWNERLWCTHAWGSKSYQHSGTYRYICGFYNLPFESYNYNTTFDGVCKRAIAHIKKIPEKSFAFDFMLIDESQDFPESFFELCALVTSSTVFIAGDIFQSIFDAPNKDSIEPDYLLSKCYRTDPRTLMFAHALGMGLFEQQKLKWLDDDEWRSCGYLVEKHGAPQVYRLSREPLRRFEDIDRDHFRSFEIVKTGGDFYAQADQVLISIIRKIQDQNPTVGPEDVGVILLDQNNAVYSFADRLEQTLPRAIGWEVNKAHETKSKVKGELFVSNRNNVKGLEFPFVVCITEKIHSGYNYRNALYMTLTRSFLQTYLVLSESANQEILAHVEPGLTIVNDHGFIETTEPTGAEKEGIKTTIKHSHSAMSFYDFVSNIFDELEVLPIWRGALFDTVKKVVGEEFDEVLVKQVVNFNYGVMLKGHADEEL